MHVKKGDVLAFKIENGNYCYAQALEEPEFAFFSLESAEPNEAASAIESDVIFRLWVHKSAPKKWVKCSAHQIAEHLCGPVPRFKQSPISGKLSIYIAGQESPATYEQVQGLECAAVWEHEHIVSRVSDQLAGKTNKWLQSHLPKQKG